MKKLLLVIIFSLPVFGFSQVDYLEFKERYNLSCRVPDSAVIVENQHLMDSLSNYEISNGAEDFYYDHAWVYYMRYMKWKNIDDLQKAANIWEIAWTRYKCLPCLKSLGSIYRHLGNCSKSLDYTELYLKEVPDSIPVDYKQMYLRYKYCRGKE